jgi:GH18 family chitinase
MGSSKDYTNIAEWKTKDTGYHTGDMVKYKSNIFRAAYWAGKEPGVDPGWSLYDELYDETSQGAGQAAKVIGYLPTWRSDLDYGNAVMYQNITHGIIAFLQFDENNLGELDDKSAKAVSAIVQQVVTAAHKAGTYISVAIGGATDYGFLNLLTAVGSNASDARLDKAVQNVVKFVTDNALDGVDLDLECWWDPNGDASKDQGGRAKSSGAHPAGSAVVSFAQKLKVALPGKLVSATLFATSWYGNSYDPALADHVDWLSIMSYDLTGSWNQTPVGPHTALYKIRKQDQYAAEQQGPWPNTAKGPTNGSTPMEDNPIFSVEDSLWYWSNPFFVNWQGEGQKIARNKLVAGVPLYGYDFAYKKDPDPESGQTPPGYKVLRYKELVQQFPGASTAANANIKVSGNTPRPSFVSASGSYPYAHNLYFETPDTAVTKLNFLKQIGLQGVIIWELSNEVWDGPSIVKALYNASGNPATRPGLPAPSFAAGTSGDQVESLADAIKNAQDLGNARNSALNVLLFVCAAEGNVDPTKFINNNKADDGADQNDAKVFQDAAYVFSQLNGGIPNGASAVLDRFRTALNWDLGNNTSGYNVATEWDNYLFADQPKGQGYLSVGYQLVFEQSGEQTAKNLDNGVSRTATQYHYVGHFQQKGATSHASVEEGDGDTTAELWLEQPGATPPTTVNEGGVVYTLDKGSDGNPVSRQQPVRDVGALNQAIAQAFTTAEQNYTPQYDNSGNLQNADPVTRLAQYTAQTQYNPTETRSVPSTGPDAGHQFRPITTGPSLTHNNPGESDLNAMQALLNLYGVNSGNYQDILNAAQSDNPQLPQQEVVAQIIEGFVPGGSLIGAVIQYYSNKELLDWKKQQTQAQGRGTFYIDQQEEQNNEQFLMAGVQSIFDIATAIIGPPEGLVADVLRGLKNIGQKLKQAGIDFAKTAEHAAPRPEVPLPEPAPAEPAEPTPVAADPKPAPEDPDAILPATEYWTSPPEPIDPNTWQIGAEVSPGVRRIKNYPYDGSESLAVRMDDGSYALVEQINSWDYTQMRLSEPGGNGPLVYRDDTNSQNPVYTIGRKPGLYGGGKGQLNSQNTQIIQDLQNMRGQSTTLNSIVDEALQNGDLTIHLFTVPNTYYDNRNIILGLNQLRTSADIKSELVIELCNAWCDVVKNLKPLPRSFSNANDYAVAVERQEWVAVQKHVQIYKDLVQSDGKLWQPSRFQGAFDDPKYGWNDFNKYLQYQQGTGHTAQIASHWSPNP